MVTQQSHIINSTKEIFSSYIQNRILIFSNNEKRTSNIYHSLISQSYILAKCYSVELYDNESIYLQWNFKLMLYLLDVAAQIRLYNWWRKPEFHTSSPSSKRSIFNPRRNNADDTAITLEYLTGNSQPSNKVPSHIVFNHIIRQQFSSMRCEWVHPSLQASS